MCIYCGNRISAHIIHEEQGEDWSPGVSVCVADGVLRVSIEEDDYWEYAGTINYCPMCRRKLGGDAL